MPKIPPHETGKRKNQVQADDGGVELPTLIVYRSHTGFEDVGKNGGQRETCRQLDQVVSEMFALERGHAEQSGREEGGVGKDECQDQKDVHGCGHGGLSVWALSAALSAAMPSELHCGTAYLNKNGSL